MLNLPFDVQSVRRFIEFLYTGDYHVSPDPAIGLLSSTALDDTRRPYPAGELEDTESCMNLLCHYPYNLNILTDRQGEGSSLSEQEGGRASIRYIPGSPEEKEMRPDAIYHGQMYDMANCYAVPALAALSCVKTKKALSIEWSAELFCGLVQQSICSTDDKQFLHMLADSAADHIHELFLHRAFESAGIAEGLAPYILPRVASKLRVAENASQNLENCVKLLETNKHCRHTQCNASFPCILECQEGTPILRCTQCRTRHQLKI